MKKILFIIQQIIHWIWGFPQNLIGFCIFIVCKIKKYKTFTYKTCLVTEWSLPYGLSLGNFIFTWQNCNESTRCHEYGHSLQSWALGILYVFIISIPSAIWCHCFASYRAKNNISYYAFYPESWANKWGGLDKDGKIIK